MDSKKKTDVCAYCNECRKPFTDLSVAISHPCERVVFLSSRVSGGQDLTNKITGSQKAPCPETMGETDRVDTGIVESAKSEDEQSTSGEKLDHSYSKDDGKQIAFLPKVPVFIL